MSKLHALAQVKAVEDVEGDPNGSFDVVLSAPTLDRDGEVIDSKAFEPLPEHITFDIDHGMSTATTVGSGTPFYDEDGLLRVRGTYSSIPRAQEVRTLVREGHIRTTSVAFMAATRTKGADGKMHVTKAELLNGAFVPIPSNRESVVLDAKAFTEKAGARNSAADGDRLQQIHDLAIENGAKCASAAPDDATKAIDGADRKGHGIMGRDLHAALTDAIAAAHPDAFVWVRDFSDEAVVFEVEDPSGWAADVFVQSYAVADGAVTLAGDPVAVRVRTVYEPADAPLTPSAPATPADEAGKSLASSEVEVARLLARATLLDL